MLLMGGRYTEGGNETTQKAAKTGGAGGDRIIYNNQKNILRLYQYLTKVGTPPSHNLVIFTSPEISGWKLKPEIKMLKN